MFHRGDLFWRVPHRYSPFPLPFAPSPTDFRSWQIEILPPQFKFSVPTVTPGQVRASLHRILIEAGIALTPATTSFDPRSWYALYRYGGDFAGTAPSLRFYPGVDEKDPRLTAVASEEVAIGITCYLLREYLGVNHIADVYPLLDRHELEYVDADQGLRPDYYCEDSLGKTLLVESKGATGTRSAITRQIDEGWEQVKNVRPVNLPLRDPCGRIVFGTHFCVQNMHPKSETTTIIKDPKGPSSLEQNPESDTLLRIAYAKLLRFTGQEVLAERLLTRRPLTPITDFVDFKLQQVREIPIFPLGITPFGDVIGIYGPTFRALFDPQKQSLLRPGLVNSLRDLAGIRATLEGVGYILTNGTMVIHRTERNSFDIS